MNYRLLFSNLNSDRLLEFFTNSIALPVFALNTLVRHKKIILISLQIQLLPEYYHKALSLLLKQKLFLTIS